MKVSLVAIVLAGLSALAISHRAVADQNVRIGFYGDSTVYGSTLIDGQYPKSPGNEPDLIQTMFQTKYGASTTGANTIYVENHGVPGAICSDFLWGQNKVTNSWKNEMATSPVDIVIMGTGINDAGRLSVNDLIFCYQQLSVIAQQNGKIFIIETPNPVDYDWNSDLWGVMHNETFAGTSTNAIVVDQWSNIMANVPAWPSLLSDKMHPTTDLYSIKAAYTYKVIAPVVDRVYRSKQSH